MTDMTEHAWTQENVAAYVAGGLSALEAERLEAHVRGCPACALTVAATRRFDTSLTALFADVQPGPDLEDRVLHRLRTTPNRPLLAGWVKRTMAAAAAVVVLGTVGAFVGPAMAKLPLPGQTAKRPASPSATPDGRRIAIAEPSIDGYPAPITEDGVRLSDSDEAAQRWFKSRERSGNDLDAYLEAALPDQNRVERQTVEASETLDTGSGARLKAHDSTLLGTVTTTNGPARGIDINGHYNTQLFGYSGRSGATKELKLREGGGNNDVDGLAFSPDGKKLAGATDNPYYQHTNRAGLGFNPADHRVAVTSGETGQKTVTVMQRVPVTVTRTVTETSGVNVQEKKDPTKVEAPDPKPQPKDTAPVVADPTKRVILRSGEIEFEVDAFETAFATVQKLVDGVKGASVSNVISKRLENGKTKGSVTVRVPPEHLDGFVGALRKELDKNGGLKGVSIGSQDVTKQYYDIESRLKAARTTEQRFLQIIKEGKGDIKSLVDAEKELGVWRTKVEELEGEIRYYNNLAALSTLTITLTEKEIRAAASLTERERVQAGVEVEDVEKAYQQVLTAVADAKGRVSKSEMKQLTAGQFNATINFEVAPESAGPVRDRMNQLGRVARLEIDRMQQAEGGTMPTDAKAKRGDTVFLIQLYNLANIAPRETATLQVAVVDVPTAYQALRDAVAKTTGRVLNAQLNEQDRQNVTAQFDFEVRRADEAAVRIALEGAGEVVARQVARAAEGESVTDAKVMYRVALLAANRLKPREILTLGVEVADVDQAIASFAVQVSDLSGAKGKLVDSRTTREPNGRVIAKLVYEVPLSAAATLAERFKAAGTPRVSQSVRDPQASDGRFATARLDVTLSNAEPREVTTLGIEVADVDATAASFAVQVKEAKGRLVDSRTTREPNGRVIAKLVYEVPLSAAATLAERFKSAGTVRVSQSVRDPQASEDRYATARLDVTLSNAEGIVAEDAGVWKQVRRGLSYSASVLLTSVTWVVFGLCVVLPWAIIGYGGYRVARRAVRGSRTDATPPAATGPTAA
jgi:hypothetical protein